MDTVPLTNLARWLAAPDRVERLADLAQGWRDQEVVVTLAPVASADDGFGAHLRRSFLAALAPGASAPARAGRACPWDPPCALDIFLREQLRVGGDGLPKPYVLCWQQTGPQIAVTLRLFGTACDWAPAAAEALVAGLTGILPWPRALPGQHSPPAILDRQMPQLPLPDLPDAPLTLCLITPMDDEGAKTDRDIAARLLSRAIRRVDALARWHGLALAPDATRALTAQAHAVTAVAVRLTEARHASPNAKGQDRLSRVMLGQIDLPPLPPDLRLVLALACRCHLGRHTNEGLGVIGLRPTA